MLRALRVRLSQGTQYIKDLRRAEPKGLIGRPEIDARPCESDCTACRDVCPTQAIALEPLRLDLGRCVFCRECVEVCPSDKIRFTSSCHMAAARPADLVVSEATGRPRPVEVSKELHKLFGRSLKLRSVSAGGCNGCELELNALGNVNFDLGRYGIEFTASPRHADAVVLSGPLTRNMREALELAYAGMPAPKFVIAFGACAISGGLYDGSDALDRDFLARFSPVLYVPGCPPHPLTFIQAILDVLGIALPTGSA